MKILLSLFSRFSHDERGVAAIIFALALIPLFGAGSAAIDYSRAFLVKNRLANALDATALAMGSSNISDEGKLKEFGQKFFNANYPAEKLGVPGAIQINITDSHITVTGSAQLPTSLMGVIGIDTLDVHALSEIAKESSAVEVAVVLDNSGSMWGSKIEAAKDAAKLLMDEVLKTGSSSNSHNKMALVPFSSAVNVGTQYKNSGWIDKNRKSPLHGINFKGKTNIFSLFNKIKNASWDGCVETRAYPLDVTDTPPDSSDGDTLWVPYFLPDEPDTSDDFEHSYLNDAVSGSEAKRQAHKKKYKNAYVNNNDINPNYWCSAPIVPLTDKKSNILSGISKMKPAGATTVPNGLAWGWRVLSPEQPFTEGNDYNDKKTPTVKAVVLMTDGGNHLGYLDNMNKSYYTAYGYIATQVQTKRLNTTSQYGAHMELNDRTDEVCENIKEKGILIFTVSFDLNSSSIKKMLKDCASDADKFYDAENANELKLAFKNIGAELGELRLSK